ncbi:MAG: hypothetical protein K0U12_04875, partial [Gammaproteobacteria bacterium]|nr:hypothetical protein [Gammaproteobacteria bacterium]
MRTTNPMDLIRQLWALPRVADDHQSATTSQEEEKSNDERKKEIIEKLSELTRLDLDNSNFDQWTGKHIQTLKGVFLNLKQLFLRFNYLSQWTEEDIQALKGVFPNLK